jgi:CHASE3 domain sensor protein
MNTLYKPEELLKLTRSGMEQSIKYFMTINEQVFAMQDKQKETINQTAHQSIELFNKTHDEYQKQIRTVMSQIQNNWQNIIDATITTQKTA